MSITSAELIFYSAANMVTDDTSTVGGAIATTSKPDLTQWAANNIAQVVSDGTDTRTVTITGRLTTGVVDTEILTLNGTTPVSGAKTWERVWSAVASATSGTRTVSVKEAAGGTVRATIGLNQTTSHIMFRNSSSDPSVTKTRDEKIFAKNTDATLTLTNAQVTLTADAAANITIALPATIDDSGTISNRLAGTGLTYSDDGVAINVPNSQNLTAGSAIGIWCRQTLSAGAAATKSTFTVKLSGTTT